MRVFGVTGWKNGGKTGLVTRLVTEIAGRGLSVSTVKHAHHAAEVDHPGTDSFRHRQAGASQVVLCSPDRWAVMTELRGADEPSLADLLARLDPVDLVLIEGYKSEPHPKIEAHRQENGLEPLAQRNGSIVAIASNTRPATDLPLFDLDDTQAIADFILQQVGLPTSGASR